MCRGRHLWPVALGWGAAVRLPWASTASRTRSVGVLLQQFALWPLSLPKVRGDESTARSAPAPPRASAPWGLLWAGECQSWTPWAWVRSRSPATPASPCAAESELQLPWRGERSRFRQPLTVLALLLRWLAHVGRAREEGCAFPRLPLVPQVGPGQQSRASSLPPGVQLAMQSRHASRHPGSGRG